MGCLFWMSTFLGSLIPFANAGLNRFTELDEFDDWLIERKYDSKNDQFVCRASMPKYGSWFGSRVRLDTNELLVVPDDLKTFTLPKTFPIARLKKSLRECNESFIYETQNK